MQLYRGPGYRVDAETERGRIRIKQSGLLAPIMRPLTHGLIEVIDGQRVIKADKPLVVSTWLPPVPSHAWDLLARAQIRALIGQHVPEQVTISITEDCPNRCRHCALPDTGRRHRLEVEEVSRVIGEALDLGTTLMIFDGGEPTTHPDLVDMVACVDDRAVSTIFTSGAGFTHQLAEELADAGLYAVNVSIDSPHPEKHDLVRGRTGVFDDAMRAIDAALSADLLVDIYVVLSRFNLDDLQELWQLAREHGAHELSFYEIVPTGRWIEEKPLTEEEMKQYFEFTQWTREMEGPRLHSIPHILEGVGCFAGRRWLHITPDGEVWPCACIPKPYGNIRGEALGSIWRRMNRDPLYKNMGCIMRDPQLRERALKP